MHNKNLKLCLCYLRTTQNLNFSTWIKTFKVSDIWTFLWYQNFLHFNLLNKLQNNLKILPQRYCFKNNHWGIFYRTWTILKNVLGGDPIHEAACCQCSWRYGKLWAINIISLLLFYTWKPYKVNCHKNNLSSWYLEITKLLTILDKIRKVEAKTKCMLN